jgi:hypothetical protein
MRPLLRPALVAVLLIGAVTVAGCSPHHASAAPSTIYSTIVHTVPASTPTAVPTGPLDTTAVTAADATACPLLTQATAADSIGMRLARIATLTQGSTVVGCRFYALQGVALTKSEHLPGPNQPALEIVTSTFTSAVAARNAAVALAEAGTNQRVVTLSGGVMGDVFQTTFDPADGPSDWTLVFNKDAKLVVVRTAVTDDSIDAVGVGNDIVAAI